MSKENEESKEITDAEKIRVIAQDLVDLAIQAQKVVANSSISYSALEEARLLVIMTNQILNEYTDRNKEEENGKEE